MERCSILIQLPPPDISDELLIIIIIIIHLFFPKIVSEGGT